MLSKILFNAPWYFYFIAFGIGLSLSYFLYFKSLKRTDVSKRVVYSLMLIRFLSGSLILLLLCSVLFKHVQTEEEPPLVLIALDNSSSLLATADSAFVKNILPEKISDLSKNISKGTRIKTLYFGDKLHPSQSAWNFKDKETNLQVLFDAIETAYANQNVGALVLVSDGIYNAGSNPVYSTDKIHFPVYTLALGDTAENIDLAIQKINYNQIAYLGNQFPLNVLVKSKKCGQARLEANLFEGNTLLEKQSFEITPQHPDAVLNFTLNAKATGLVKYTVKLSTVNGEKNLANNVQSVFIEVIDNKEKILLLAGAPHPDIAAIREAVINNSNYILEYFPTEQFKTGFKPYSLVILHGLSASNNQILKQLNELSVPVWIINPGETNNLPGLKILANDTRFNDFESAFNPNFNVFGVSKEFQNFVSELPALKSFFGDYRTNNSIQTLLYQKIATVKLDNPLFYFLETNNQKVAVFLGDGLWRWRFRDFNEHRSTKLVDELICKSVQYLSVKNDKSFFRINHPKWIHENEALEFTAELYNKSYELINEPDISLRLYRADKKTFEYTFGKSGNHYQLNVGELRPGEYSYEAKVMFNQESYVKKGMVTVKEMQHELQNTVANHQLLYQLSSKTGGKLIYPANIQSLEDELNKNELVKPVVYSQTVTDTLIDFIPVLILILLFLALEWFLRKRFFTI